MTTPFHRARALLTAATVLATAAALAFAVRSATSQGGGGGSAVDFAKITYLPAFPATSTVPDYTHPTHCQYPADERPAPDLPPLSCRNTGGEPSPGAIPSAGPRAAAALPTARAGWKLVDNRLFRLTVQIPDTWYSDMRPEGGSFSIYDPAATANAAKGLPGTGLALGFGAREYVPPIPGIDTLERKLERPNLTIAGVPAVLYDEGAIEGLSHWFTVAFRSGEVLYVIGAYVGGGRPDAEVQRDIAGMHAILATVSLY